MGGASARIATRGPGEMQLEMDRRHIRERVQRLENSLKVIQQQRAIQRQRRMKSGMPLVGIVGYTNAGKSTLLNRLTQAGVLAENRLFSTLDTTVRSLAMPGGFEVGLIDTVGFVSKLPHSLVAAFRATLEEITYADIILHVADATSPRLEIECAATDEILTSLKCETTPRLTVWNKIDRMDDPVALRLLPHNRPPAVAISALENIGITELLAAIEKMVLEHGHLATLLIPYERYDLVARLHRESQVLETRDTEKGKLLRCRLAPHLSEVVAQYLYTGDWDEETEAPVEED
jgi:GTP-binding protein HflX